MRKFIIAGLAGALSLVGLVGLAHAAPGGNGNGNNQHGMCTAYFNGQKKGWTKNGTPGPFASFESAAESAEPSSVQSSENQAGVDESAADEKASDVFAYCDQGANIGGNPDQNGRFASCFSTDSTGGSEFSC